METETKKADINKVEEVKKEKKQAISASYTISAFSKNVEKLIELGFITKHNEEVIGKLVREIKIKYVDSL